MNHRNWTERDIHSNGKAADKRRLTAPKMVSRPNRSRLISGSRKPKEVIFREAIENFIAQQEKLYKDCLEELWDGPLYPDYSFHDYPDRLTFSFDGTLYEDLNGYNGWAVRNAFDRAMEDAGLEWGEDMDWDTYSDISLYKR